MIETLKTLSSLHCVLRVSKPLLLIYLYFFLCFLLTVKVLRFNRRRPLPDAEDSDFQNTYLVNGISSSVTVTGYRSEFQFIYSFVVRIFGENVSEIDSIFNSFRLNGQEAGINTCNYSARQSALA